MPNALSNVTEGRCRSGLRAGIKRWSAVAALSCAVVGIGNEAKGQVDESLLQPEFPFQRACIGAPRPAGNIANKGIAIRLGNDAHLCFDTDLLRVSAGWTGQYITTKGVAFDGGHGGHPQIAGEQQFGTEPVSGWADRGGNFTDPREEPFGPIPSEWGRWDGLYVQGDDVVLGYTVHGTKIHEQPSSVVRDGLTGIVRTFQIEEAKADLRVLLCDVAGTESRVEGKRVYISHSDDKVTAVAVDGAPQGAKLTVADDSRVSLALPEGVSAALFKVTLWHGQKSDQEKFAGLLKGDPAMVDYEKGGSAHWPEPVVTQGSVSSSDDAYVVDRLTPPVNNPWERRVRLGGLDFFEDGTRAALCTWDGDVWVVSGIDEDLDELRWRRFASGGYETLGLEIVDGVIYTSGRDEITRYHDFNGDGAADYYENFNNDITSSTGFHEFVFDLQQGPDGDFFMSKAGPVRGGGRGFGGGGGNGRITKHAGSVLRVSEDGKELSVYATGFRAPNGIGLSPSGQVTTGDNEGTWVPACPINWVEEGGFYGVETLAHREPAPEYDKPLCWLSHGEFDNSGGGQVWVSSDRWGPFEGELLHMSYGQCALYLVMKQQVGEQMQGGVVQLPVRFSSSAMRARFNPKDGQLYVCGLRGWQTKAAQITGFDRIRYTGKRYRSVEDLKVNEAGVHLTFTVPLDRKEATDVQNYSVERWNYRRSDAYGSPEFSVSNPDEQGRDTVELTAAELSEDGRTVTLKVADLREAMQMQIQYLLLSEDGAIIEQKVLHTIHEVPNGRERIARK